MKFEGLLIGIATFLLIGLFHPIVIKAEYHFGKKSNIYFFFAGIIFAVLSVITQTLMLSILFGVTACCSFWSIKEVNEQEERVLKGWFPENPKRKEHYDKLRKQMDYK